MSDAIASLIVKLGADIAEFSTGMDKARKQSIDVMDGLSKVGGAAVAGAFAATGVAVAGMTAFLVDSAMGAAEAEKVQSQLAAVIKSTGGAAGVTADQVNDLASALSEVTTFEDDTIVSGENMLLTFTNIGKNVFPEATQTMLDMAQAMGSTDLKGTAIQLGKALQDPVKGVSALAEVGVNFTAEQKKMIEEMVKAGKVEQAQKFILKELQTEFGGSAKAAGGTFAGQLKILENQFGNIKDTIGAEVLPVISQFVTLFASALKSDTMQATIKGLVSALQQFATFTATAIPQVITWFQNLATWLQNNQGVIVGILAALGVAVAAFVFTTVIPAAIAMIGAMAPILAVLAIAAAAGYLLYQAWTENWGGIRDSLTSAWAQIQPIFDKLWGWIQQQIPVAVKFLTDVWNNTLLPALKQFFAWVSANLIPKIVEIAKWLEVNVPIAVQTLVNFWNNTLMPVLQDAWAWIDANLMPLFNALATLIGETFARNMQIASFVWDSYLYPALQAMWSFIQSNVLPILATLADMFGKNITSQIQFVTNKIKEFTGWLNTIQVPSWLGGSGSNSYTYTQQSMGMATVPGMSAVQGVGAAPVLNLTYAPAISLADQREVQTRLTPYIQEALRNTR